MSLAKAREAARAFEPPKASAAARRDARFEVVAERWLSEHVEPRGLRSAGELRRHVARYMAPAFAGRRLHDIDQDDITDLLDRIAEHHGAVMADHVLASLQNLLGWWRAKDKSYAAVPWPIVRGMRRGAAAERERVLDDDELRLFWRLTGDGSVFGGLCRMLLLTGQRLQTVRTMRWTDIDADGVWVVPGKQGSGKRKAGDPKGTIGAVRLPPLALDTLRSLPRVAGSPFVFPGVTAALVDVHRQQGPPVQGYGGGDAGRARRDDGAVDPARLAEDAQDAAVAAQGRLSGRRVGARPHASRGSARIYDRYDRFEEKSEALARFATHVLASSARTSCSSARRPPEPDLSTIESQATESPGFPALSITARSDDQSAVLFLAEPSSATSSATTHAVVLGARRHPLGG